jgi:serine/threonine-protein kinase RsbW
MRQDMPARTVRVAAEINQLPSLRRLITEAAAGWQVAPALIDQLELAVDELASNIIMHGYRGQAGSLEMEIERTAEAVVVRLRDDAPPFDPTQLPAPDLTLPPDQRPTGGLGVYLARCSCDRITHEVTEQGGNLLTLVKWTPAT